MLLVRIRIENISEELHIIKEEIEGWKLSKLEAEVRHLREIIGKK
jgi:hypothetical protein